MLFGWKQILLNFQYTAAIIVESCLFYKHHLNWCLAEFQYISYSHAFIFFRNVKRQGSEIWIQIYNCTLYTIFRIFYLLLKYHIQLVFLNWTASKSPEGGCNFSISYVFHSQFDSNFRFVEWMLLNWFIWKHSNSFIWSLFSLCVPFIYSWVLSYTALNTLNISQVNNLFSIQWLDKYVELIHIHAMVVHCPFNSIHWLYFIIRNFAPHTRSNDNMYTRLKSVKLTFQLFPFYILHCVWWPETKGKQ